MDQKTVYVLLVEDEKAHIELVSRAFDEASYTKQARLAVVRSLEQARACLAETPPDLVIADLLLPDGTGMDLLPAAGESPRFPVILTTSHGDEEVAVDAIKAGALDYVVKSPTTLADMPRIATRALREWGHIVERKQAEEAMRRRAEELAALQATVLDITVRHDLPTLLETIVERATRLLDTPIGGLYLCEPDQEQVRCVVSHNTPRDYRGIVLKHGEGAAGTVAQTGEPLNIADYSTWKGRATVYDEESPFRAVLAVPMTWQDEVIGVIDVVEYADGRLFTQDDLDLLSLFANHAAIAVENTRLYEQAQEEILERQRLEQRTRERRLYLESLLNSAPDAIVTMDAQHHVSEWNPGAERLFGYSREEAIGQDLDKLIALSDPDMFEEAVDLTQQALTGDVVAPTETIRFRQDGTPVNVILAGSPILIQEELVGTIAIYTDVTELKQAEEALRESEETYRTLVHTSPDAVTMTDLAGRITYASPQTLKLHGFDREEELLGRSALDLIAPEDHERALANLQKTLEVEFVRSAEHLLLRRDGTCFVGELNATLIRDPSGDPKAFMASTRDITERKEAEANLRELKEFNESIVQNMAEGIAVQDVEGYLTFINPAAAALLGYLPEELEGQYWTLIVPPDQQPIVKAADERRMRGESDRYEVELLRKNGTRLSTLIAGSPRYDPDDGHFVGTLAVFTDISERVQAEERLAQRAEEMAALYEAEARQRREVETLQAATQAVTATLDLRQVFELILSELREVVPYDSASVQQLKGNWLEIIGGHGFPNLEELLGVGFDLAAQDNPNREVIRTRAPMILEDAPAVYAEFRRDPHAPAEIRSWLGVPLLFGDRLIGMIALDKQEPGFYTEEHARLAMAFAAQAAVALENAQLFQETEQRLRELALLNETSTALSISLDLDTVAHTVARHITTTLEIEGCTISSWDREQGALVTLLDYAPDPSRWKTDPPGTVYRLADFPGPRRVLAERHSLAFQMSDPSADPIAVEWMKKIGVKSLLLVPLVVRDEAVGLLELMEAKEEREFTPTEIALCETLANQAAAALENARLFQAEHAAREQAEAHAAELRARERHLLLLNDITRTALEMPDMQTMLQILSDRMGDLLEAGGCFITLWDRDRQTTIPAAASGPMSKVYANLRAEPGKPTITETVLRDREPLIIEDLLNTPYISLPTTHHFQALSILALPLTTGDEKLGAALIVYNEPHQFSPDEVERAKQAGGQVALAIAKARLFQAEREQRELAEALRQAAAAVSSTLDLEQILDHILEQVSRVIPNDAVNVNLIEGDYAHIVRWLGYERFGQEVHSVSLHLADTPSLQHMQETGTAIVIPDTAASSGWVHVPEVDWVRSYAGAPIRVRDEVIGFLNTDSAQPDFFDQAHADRLQAFANQAGLAIGNAWHFRNMEQGKRDWETTFDAMQDAVSLVDRDQQIVRANQAFADLVQKELSQIVGQEYYTVLDGTTCLGTTCRLEQTAERGQPTTCTHEYRGRVFDVQATPILEDDDQGPDGSARTIYVMRDITERQQAEDEIRRRNRELALLNRVIAASAANQEIEPILETVCRELAMAFDISHSAAALLNEQKTELTITAEYQPKDHRSILGTIIQLPADTRDRYIALKTPQVFEDARADPRLVPIHPLIDRRSSVSMLLIPLLVDEEVVGGLSLSSTEPRSFSAREADLAQRVAHQVSGALARIRLAKTQRQLSTAVEQAAEAVIITDTDGTILYVNPAFEHILGLSRTDVIGHGPRILKGGDLGVAMHQELWRAVTSGQVWQERLEETRRDGSPYTLDLMAAPVRNQGGEIVSFVATMRDVTREVQLEEQFRQSQKMEALGRLAGGIAHDFNNLLTVINLSTRLLQRQLHPQDPLWEHVQRIQETGGRAAKLTKQLLSFSRREVIEPQVLNLSQVVSDLSRMLQRIIGEDITMEMVLADDLWPLKVDPSQIDQVLMNLVVNARDAMPEGGILTIETANVTLDEAYAVRHVDARPGDYVMLAISDTGVGMDEETRDHLFEPFFTTKERGEGTGLGLATVFGIVRQSRGHIEVHSQLGQGTTFRIYIPRGKRIKTLVPPPAPTPLTRDLPRGAETVLVVEDEMAVRELAVNVLKSCGYHVLAAQNGPEALQISEEHGAAIHMLITDIVMPQMNGRELAERLQAQQPGLRVLYVSGYADKGAVQERLPTPGTVFLPKPFTIEELTHKVRAILDDQG